MGKVLSGLSNTLKRTHELTHESMNRSAPRRKKKCVKFVTATKEGIQASALVSPSNLLLNNLADPTLPDFCIQHDFCIRIQKCSKQSQANNYIGYFEKAGPCKHLVYFSPPVLACQTEPVSLAQVISSISKQSEINKLLQYERLRLAKQLAAAVLQFYATPLMKGSWWSEDVVFFDAKGEIKQQSKALDFPHLNVQVQQSQ